MLASFNGGIDSDLIGVIIAWHRAMPNLAQLAAARRSASVGCRVGVIRIVEDGLGARDGGLRVG